MAVDGTSVYWGDCGTAANDYTDGSVMKVPLSGGTVTTLASAQECPLAVAVDSTSVYYIASDNVLKMPLDGLGGGTPTTLATGQGNAILIAVSGGTVVWLTYNEVVQVASGGGTPVTLSPTGTDFVGYPTGMAVDSTNVYWTGWQTPIVMKVPIIGGEAATTLWSGHGAEGVNEPYGVGVDSTNVYWTDNATETLMTVPIVGGTATTLVSSQANGNVAVDSTSVYYSNVMSVPVGGGTPTTLATGAGVNVVDATSIYWIGDDTIMKLTPK